MLSVTDGTTEIGAIERISSREHVAFVIMEDGSSQPVGTASTIANDITLIRERRVPRQRADLGV